MISDGVAGSETRTAANGVFWNALGILTRQLFLVISALWLARILGPDSYAVVALAGVYTAFTTLLLDQGLTAPLISKKNITSRFIGAATTLNILSALVIGFVTVILSPLMASAVNVDDMRKVLTVFALALPLKALSIAPRAILARSINFKTQAIVDVCASFVGAITLVIFVLVMNDYWAFVYQVVAVDTCVAIGLLALVRPPFPNLQLRLLAGSFVFGSRVLASNLLAYSVQNLDSVLVGRYLGQTSLSYFSVAHRLVTMPVQLVGQIVSRVMFPLISNRYNLERPVKFIVEKAISATAIVILPIMALIAVSSPDLIDVVLGGEWKPAAMTLTIFAIAGGRQALTTLNSPVLMGIGRADILLKFSMGAAALQISAIVVGLNWGINGVALSYTLAGFALTPVVMLIQRKAIDIKLRTQMNAVGPGLHCAIWVVIVYLSVRFALGLGAGATLTIGAIASLAITVLTLSIFHRTTIRGLTGLLGSGRESSGGPKPMRLRKLSTTRKERP
ncbi:hypothetical protein BJD99_00270 [Rhodococcus sp. 1163]|uniref:lipopolysaccharide biosynthesis protein n=1 Tax=Rhodococcus sp. 1163 TaxID=1905289 RepID=UPI0009FD9229|nr:lipopolysaccharide biosynthesis protein [Rhodococcus sp. 1163]ORI19570.1 hypothetical protein BJD99_00270 [Rhodococcus sp. 1163]